MNPAFGIEGGVALAVVRGLFDAALLTAFGTALLTALIARPLLAGAVTGAFWFGWSRLAWGGVLTALALAVAWLVLQAASLADADSLGEAFAAVAAVVPVTQFGRLWAVQFALLAATALALWRGRRCGLAAAFSGLAVAAQAWHGHAAAMQPGASSLLASGVVHLLAAGAWLGALPALAWLVASVPADVAARASQRFSVLGIACVAAIASTALVQSWTMVGGMAGLIGTGYGLTALAKLALFAALLGFAALHRFVLTPKLDRANGAVAKRTLARSIGSEAGLGLLVVLAAGLLTSQAPGMHAQPIWPLSWQLSFAAVQDDPELWREAAWAAAALVLAAALLALAFLRRRVRWPATAAAVAIGWFALPHLSVLRAEAYPTSFYQSPTGFSAGSIVTGRALFAANCVSCHGAGGRGDGPAAKGLRVPPADLTADHIWAHSDGEMFWWLLNGIDDPEGGLAMPGFPELNDGQRWALIDYVRAHAAGAAMAARGEWVTPIQAPGLEAVCPDGRTIFNAKLLGQPWRIVAGPPAGADALTAIWLADAPGQCADASAEAREAIAIVTGVASGGLEGVQVLVDADGWMRGRWLPGERLDANAADTPLRAMSAHHHQ